MVNWLDDLVDYLISIDQKNTFFWCLNPNSGDTGGLLKSDWTTEENGKLEALDVLQPFPSKIEWQSDSNTVCVSFDGAFNQSASTETPSTETPSTSSTTEQISRNSTSSTMTTEDMFSSTESVSTTSSTTMTTLSRNGINGSDISTTSTTESVLLESTSTTSTTLEFEERSSGHRMGMFGAFLVVIMYGVGIN